MDCTKCYVAVTESDVKKIFIKLKFLVLVVRMVRTVPFLGFSCSSKGLATFQPRQAGDKAGSILRPHNSCDSTALMRGTQKFGLTGGSLWQLYPHQDQPAHRGGFGIDPRLGAAALRASVVSREDSRPQHILKFYHHSSLNNRAHHGLTVK